MHQAIRVTDWKTNRERIIHCFYLVDVEDLGGNVGCMITVQHGQRVQQWHVTESLSVIWQRLGYDRTAHS